jgi:hypothetical protein
MNGTRMLQSATNRMRCLACGTEIRETEQLSRPDIVYRCPVCRLDFVRDPGAHTLTLAPLRLANPDTPMPRLPLNESRNEGGGTPPNLIRERVPLEVVPTADDAKRTAWPKKAAAPAPEQRKRRTRT